MFLVSLFLSQARGTCSPSDPHSVISPTRIHINAMSSQEERSPQIEPMTTDMSTTHSLLGYGYHLYQWLDLPVIHGTHQRFINSQLDPSESLPYWPQHFQRLPVVNTCYYLDQKRKNDISSVLKSLLLKPSIHAFIHPWEEW